MATQVHQACHRRYWYLIFHRLQTNLAALCCWYRAVYSLLPRMDRNRLVLSLESGADKMSRLVGKPTMWFPNRSDTNRPVQSQKRARSLKFWIYKVEELYYPCSENKGADQLRSYCEADLRLCFRLCRLLVFA